MDKNHIQQQPWKPSPKRPPIWDCGSSLYDSFELDSFQRRLDSALSARSLSMPHLDAQPPPLAAKPVANGSRMSRSFKKLIRSVFFRGKSKAPGNDGKGKERRWFVVLEDDVVFEKSGLLSAIPEAPEAEKMADLVWPEIGRVVGKAVSERFAARSVSMNVISSRALV